jgi:hypothetical protein
MGMKVCRSGLGYDAEGLIQDLFQEQQTMTFVPAQAGLDYDSETIRVFIRRRREASPSTGMSAMAPMQ